MKGIDVSKYQGAINWASVRADGIGFAMIRAGYGMYPQQKDPYFDQNVLGAQSQGIHTGAYLYSYAKSVEDAQREADVFLDWIQPYRLDYPVAFDIEDASQENLSREMCIRDRADRIVFIDEGKITEISTPEEFFTHPKTERAQRFLYIFHFETDDFRKEV